MLLAWPICTAERADTKKMIYYYLLAVDQFRTNMDYLKQTFEKNLSDEEIKELQLQIFTLMQQISG
jgi:hypothetical protein